MMDVLEQIKSLTARLGTRFDDLVGRTEGLEQEVKGLRGLRGLVDQYARQLPALSRDGNGGGVDSLHKGVFPNQKQARDMGLFVLAGFHKSPETRIRCAENLVKSGSPIRHKDGGYAANEDFVKAMGIGSDAAGGYLVPEEIMASLIRNVEARGVARRALRVVPMSSDRQSWPKRTGGLTVYYPDEGVAATVSNLAFGKVTLTAKKWVVYSLFSRELEEDSAAELGELVAEEISLAIALAEDTNCFMGDGTSTYCGIVGVMTSANVAVLNMDSTKTTFASIQLKDFTNLIATAPDWVGKMPDAAFYMHPSVWALVQSAAWTAGLIIHQGLAEGVPLQIAGYPVILSRVLPSATAISTKFVIFGSMRSWAILGNRRVLTLERSTEVKWLEDQVAIKAVPRQDIQEVDGTALAILKTAGA